MLKTFIEMLLKLLSSNNTKTYHIDIDEPIEFVEDSTTEDIMFVPEESTAKTTVTIPRYVTEEEYLNKHLKNEEFTETHQKNMEILLDKICTLRHIYKKPFIVTSGWRPTSYNAKIGGAKNSAHITCEAIDIKDVNGEIATWLCDENFDLLQELDLYIENPAFTKTWVHIQTRPTRSGSRIFKP